MKQLFTATIQHLKQSFSFFTFFLCFITIAVACCSNYYGYFKLWPVHESFTKSFFFLFVLFFVFFTAGLAFTLLNKHTKPVWNNHYKWIFIAAPAVFALKVSLPFDELLLNHFSAAYQLAFHKAAAWMGGFLFTVPVLMLLYYLFEQKWNLYFIKKTNSFTPYLVLLLCMVPLLLFASAQTSFQQVYPRSKDVAMALGNSATPFHYIFFELGYAMDFITIELFFRGLLIATVSRVLGIRCIIPVALFYFSIHLGKPMLEAISSFFGGLILGAVSYETKSIWGGWMVHFGIALLMELLGYIM
ncbi:MAG: CPBP family intramembrane metalloprotease [Chitinophagaceae bacterium]|nr:CPBP family intramembrane metalloprotease [Chitinophagaceae bacterium]